MFGFLKKYFNRQAPVPVQTIIQRHFMHPLSIDRYNWLATRQQVLEPVINTLKLYVTGQSAGVAQTNVQAALQNAQVEFLQNSAELSVLKDHFDRLEKQQSTGTEVTIMN